MAKRFIVVLLCGMALSLVVMMFAGGLPVNAQGDECAAGFLSEVERLSRECSALPPGMICASADGVGLQQRDTGAFSPLTGRASLAGSTAVVLDPDVESGLAVMQLPALEEGRSISGVLWGDARLLDAPAPPKAPICNARSLGSINVRSEPGTQATILGQLALDQEVPIVARLADATWWRIEWAGQFAWVFAELTPADCDPETMLVYDPATGEISGGAPTPDFQAARLETALTAPACPAIPHSGALLQSPAGGAGWLLNGMQISLDGTIWVQAPLHDVMAVQVLEGQVVVETGQVSRAAAAGQVLRVPLRDGVADGVPGPALEGLAAGVENLPLGLLPRQIAPPPAAGTLPGSPGTIQCGIFPQQIVLTPDSSGAAEIALMLDEAQTVRLSAAGPGVAGLTLNGDALPAGEAGAGALIVPEMMLEAGNYQLAVDMTSSEPVTVGVTCDLPVISAADAVLSCDDLLLHWDAVQGGSVSFSTPSAARVSVLVTHGLPSEGPAGTLAVVTAGGETLAQADFSGVGAVQVAGPLPVAVQEAGMYRVEWDGDPFNTTSIEVICEMAPVETAEE
ncbi:MAG: SH3 domain-containing protein [Anaerolineae bacterium]|nr:SH3 domain-containing protein [Anaerolineae bacterium]